MKVAYIFLSPIAGIYYLTQIILPQLEAGNHGMEVVAMCFFDENSSVLHISEPFGQRLSKIAKEKNILLMAGERDAQREDAWGKGKRAPNECVVINMVDGEEVSCFPDIYTALADNVPERIISI